MQLQGKTDARFTEAAFKIFRDKFDLRPVLTTAQFLEQVCVLHAYGHSVKLAAVHWAYKPPALAMKRAYMLTKVILCLAGLCGKEAWPDF